MIRYAGREDVKVLERYDRHISAGEVRNAVDRGGILLMEKQGVFVGWLRYNLFWDNTPFMNMLYFLEEYRGKGYGTELVHFWEAEMWGKGYDMVLTSTQSDEQAQFFYRKNGYTDCGALLLPGEPLEILLLKRLSCQFGVKEGETV